MDPARELVVILPVCLAVACTGRPESGPATTRLADLYKPELVSARVAPSPPPPRTEWRFDGPAPAAVPGEKAKNPAGVRPAMPRTTATQPSGRGKPPWRRIERPSPRLKTAVPTAIGKNMSLFSAFSAIVAEGGMSSAVSPRGKPIPAKIEAPTTIITPPSSVAVESPPSSPVTARIPRRSVARKKSSATQPSASNPAENIWLESLST